MTEGRGDEDVAVWLYAVIPATRAANGAHALGLGGLTGVAREPVRLIGGENAFAAVAGTVPLSDFAEAPLRDHLEDLDWLERAARAHHTVIDAVGEGDAVPLRFATIYHDDAAVTAVLRERAADFASALERVAGRTEWGVKAYADPEDLAEPPAEATSAARSPGTAYLLRRRAQRRGQEEAQRRALARAEEIRALLGELAERGVRHPPQDARLAGYRGWMILNDSFLVENARGPEFAELVASCRERFPEVRLELSGPWPAYSFTTEEAE